MTTLINIDKHFYSYFKIYFLVKNHVFKVIKIKISNLKLIFLFVLILSIVFVNSAYAGDVNETQTLTDDNFDSIQNLIDNANAGDSISLDGKTYSGNGSAVHIDKDITIRGDDSQSTVLDANEKSNIFVISKGVNVNFIGLTFKNGFTTGSGAAIDNNGKLTIYNSTICNNHAQDSGAIHTTTGATLTINNCLFDSNLADTNGAAIDNYMADLVVINSTFINNKCNEGGAIYNRIANFLIYDSTFVNNTAERGGGVYNNKGLMKIYNSQFYSNTAHHLGGGIKSFGNCEVYDTIVVNNTSFQGGGLFVSQNSMKVTNCFVKDNVAEEGGGFFADVKATLTIKDTQIINNSATVNGGGINVYQGYLTLTNSILKDNHAPELGGGIFYSDYPYSSSIKNLVLENNNANLGGGIYVGTLTVSMQNITLKGNSALNGAAIYNTGNLTLRDMTFSSNNAANQGGAIYTSSALTVDNADFTSNEARYAGAIYSLAFTDIKNSRFSLNSAYDTGVIFSKADLNIDNSEFTNNRITRTYGMIMILEGNVNITDSLFDSNRGADEGGCIFIETSTNVHINNSRFTSNKAKSYGAAIDNSGNLTIENSLFDKNQAYGAGAIDNGGTLTIIKSNFTNNKATINGGAIDNKGNMTVSGSVFENNVAGGNGGAVIARRGTEITHSIICNNFDSNGYAIFNSTWDDVSVSNNWWGENNPDFNALLNFNTSDDFNWIVMTLTNATPLIQSKSAIVNVNVSTVVNKNNESGSLADAESLPVFKAELSSGVTVNINDGSLSKEIVPLQNTFNVTIDNQSLSLNVNVNPVNVKRIINNKNVVVDYNSKATFKVRIIGDDGNPVGKGEVVVMKINGKSYKVKTDEKGYASRSFSLLPAKYTITATYKGFTVKNQIKVNKVLTAKSITKKKAKKIKYTATLKTSKGKAIVAKKVTFKIKGKTYSAKTNKKGIATVTFKNLKVGKYSVVVSYVNSKVKTTLKVKK